MTPHARPKPRGFRRLERWTMGVVMGMLAFVLEKVVMRSIRKEGGTAVAEPSSGTAITSKGAEIDVEDL
jgi:hypothetical protein